MLQTVNTDVDDTDQEFDWDSVQQQFSLSPEYIHLGASQFIASHPRPVQEAIERHRDALNRNPVLYTMAHEDAAMQDVRIAAANYLAMEDADDVALTDSTTMGLGTIYTGLNLQKGQEILTTQHDHYAHRESIHQATQRTGTSVREVQLYQNLKSVTVEEMVASITNAVSDKTRVVGIPWVNSGTGLKTPVAEIAAALAKINQSRTDEDRILLIVDGVHGFGIERETFSELGCDFLISGCHKWLYGPRGTGLIAAAPEAWQVVSPVIPSFSDAFDAYYNRTERPKRNNGRLMTPGGFHSMEHRWALLAAFQFVEKIGRDRIYARVHQLGRQCKEGLAAMPHVTLHTPLEDDLSAGIVAFEVRGLTTGEVVEKLLQKNIIATAAPYPISYARFTPGIYNTPEEIDRALEAVQSLSER
ncbi:MAG: Aminotransferase, class [Bacilli bacterium]|nr:Aminotransferase, class [Bacilli bacterium]